MSHGVLLETQELNSYTLRVQKPEAARIPTFGSKAISPNGRPINTDHERTSVVLDDKSEIFHAGHDVESQSSGGKGIPIMVERSVV